MKTSKLRRKLQQEWKSLLFNLVFAFLTMLFVILFYEHILLASIFIGVLGVVGLIKWKSKLTLSIFILTAILGTLAEMYTVSKGVWSYAVADLINVPSWLFFVWGNAGAFIYQTTLGIKRLGTVIK